MLEWLKEKLEIRSIERRVVKAIENLFDDYKELSEKVKKLEDKIEKL